MVGKIVIGAFCVVIIVVQLCWNFHENKMKEIEKELDKYDFD